MHQSRTNEALALTMMQVLGVNNDNLHVRIGLYVNVLMNMLYKE